MIWDKLATKYDRLWVQKYSLGPTRLKILAILERYLQEEGARSEVKNLCALLPNNSISLLDVGCGTGQLLTEIRERLRFGEMTGIDKSLDMLEQAKTKKHGAELIHMDINHEMPLSLAKKKFHYIICSHSFPYYEKKESVLEKLYHVLTDDGLAIFVQASINSKYDAFAMSIIEKTAEKAEYLSKVEFTYLTDPYFNIVESFTLKERWYMPSICGFVMRKKV